jgi:hypothetical protein
MNGQGRHSVLAIDSADPLLRLVGAVGLGASVGTALVVDMASTRGRTLVDLVTDGPTAYELSPGRAGLAFIGGGGLDSAGTEEVVGQLARRWPAVVVAGEVASLPAVRFNLLYPGRLAPVVAGLPGVWQPVEGSGDPPGPGPVMPRLRRSLLTKLLNGHLPRRSAWIDAWHPIWEMPWA